MESPDLQASQAVPHFLSRRGLSHAAWLASPVPGVLLARAKGRPLCTTTFH